MASPGGRSAAVTTAVMPWAFAAWVTSSSRILAVRGRRADDPGPQLARGAEVVAEPPAPAEQAGVFLPGQPGADHAHKSSAGWSLSVRPDWRARAVATMASMMPW